MKRFAAAGALSILAGACAAPGAAWAQSCPDRIIGMNVAGPAFAPDKLPGVLGQDYKFPTHDDLARFATLGFNAIRFSILWERMQPQLNGPLDQAYLNATLKVLDDAASLNLRVLLDLHNYGKYGDKTIGKDPQVTSAAFADLWKRLAAATKDKSALFAYGLVNEPNTPEHVWHSVAQYGVDAIRSVDSVHQIYVPGDGWSATAKWPDANPEPFVKDPANREVYEGHLYIDNNAAGRYLGAEASAPDTSAGHARHPGNLTANLQKSGGASSEASSRVADGLQPFLDWLKRYNKKGAIGEFAVPSNGGPDWMAAVNEFYEVAKDQCLTTFYWGGGPFSPSNVFSLQPVNGQQRPIIQLMQQRMADWKK